MSRIDETGGARFNRTRGDQTLQNRSTFVQPGETSMGQIARRLNLLEALLVRWNPQIPNPNSLEAGMEVFLSRRFGLSKQQGGVEAQSPSLSAAAAERNFEQLFEAALRKREFQGQAAPQTAAAPEMVNQPKTEPGAVGQVWSKNKTTVAGNFVNTTVQPTPTPFPAYDPKVGPRITPDMWTMEMMTAPLTQELLANQKDPAAFLNARKELLSQPTPAKVVNLFDGSSQPLGSRALSSEEQVQGLYNHLLSLGMSPAEITDQAPVGLFRVDYNGETRRHWAIGGMNAGELLMRYATTPVELADQQTKDELRAAGLLGGAIS